MKMTWPTGKKDYAKVGGAWLILQNQNFKNTLEQELFTGLFGQLTWKKGNEHNETNEKEFDRNWISVGKELDIC